MVYLKFESNGRSRTINRNEVAFIFPSIVEKEEVFITLKTGKQYRARHVEELNLYSGH